MQTDWDIVLQEVAKKIPPRYYEQFISTLEIKEFSPERCILRAPSQNVKNHIERKYQQYIENAILETGGNYVPIEILVDAEPEKFRNFVNQRFEEEEFSFNPDYSFDKFIVGNSNKLAYIAATECAKKPGEINPLYLFGPVGVGKTHLLHSIGSHILQNNPWMSVKYIDIHSFMSEFRFVVQSRESLETFKIKYQSYNVLLIDDIQYLNESATKTQEEFFTLFNFLYGRKRQIVIASDRPSHELPIQERLKSRFITGVQANISTPQKEVRIGILKHHAQLLDIELTPESLDYIADKIPTDTRGLLGALNDISLYKRAYSHLVVPPQTVISIIQNRIHRQELISFSHEKVVELVSREFAQDIKDVMSKSRKKELILPRHLSMYLLHEVYHINKSQIGRIFQTGHTTVINAVQNIQNKLLEEDSLRDIISRVRSQIDFQ